MLELENFRKKYPQYSDIDDATLANKLAQKYPDAYGDLPGKVAGPMQRATDIGINPFVAARSIGNTSTPPMSFGQKLKEAAKNIPRSLVENINAIGENPIFALAPPNIAKTAGVVREGYQNPQAALETIKGIPGQLKEQVQGLIQHPVDSAAKMIVENPVGYASLVAPLLTKPTTLRPGALTAEQVGRVALGQKTNVPLTVADIKGPSTKFWPLIEAHFKRNIATADIAQEAAAGKVDAVERFAKEVQGKVGGPLQPLEAGQLAQEASHARYGRFMQNAQKLYEGVGVDKDIPIETNNLRDAAIGHFDELGKLKNPRLAKVLDTAKNSAEIRALYTPGAPELSTQMEGGKAGFGKGVWRGKPPEYTFKTTPEKGILDQFGNFFNVNKENMPSYTWAQLLDDRKNIGKLWRTTSDRNLKRVYRDLISAIDDDITEFSNKVGVPEVATRMKAATNYYKLGDDTLPGVRTWRDRQIANMMQNTSPEDIVGKFFKPNNASDMQRLVNTAGPEGTQALKQAWVEKLVTKGEEGSFNLSKFVTAFDKYDDVTLRTFLKPDEYAGLKELSKISKISQTAERVARGTGSEQHNILWATGASFLRHPIVTSIATLGGNRFANAYFNNPAFRRTLIFGLKGTPESVQAINAARKMQEMVTAGVGATSTAQTLIDDEKRKLKTP